MFQQHTAASAPARTTFAAKAAGASDPTPAAYQFAGPVMGKPIFAAPLDPDEPAHIADRAAEAFLAAHGPPRTDQVSVSFTGALIFVPSRAKSW